MIDHSVDLAASEARVKLEAGHLARFRFTDNDLLVDLDLIDRLRRRSILQRVLEHGSLTARSLSHISGSIVIVRQFAVRRRHVSNVVLALRSLLVDVDRVTDRLAHHLSPLVRFRAT